jgi:hypothetical protein
LSVAKEKRPVSQGDRPFGTAVFRGVGRREPGSKPAFRGVTIAFQETDCCNVDNK